MDGFIQRFHEKTQRDPSSVLRMEKTLVGAFLDRLNADGLRQRLRKNV